MSSRPNALGRGLGALLPGVSPAGQGPAPAPTPGPASGPEQIALREIEPNPEQPRRHFDPEELERLAESIRRHGILQPVVVRRAGDRYQLVVGERRWRASQVAGLEKIPAVVADVAERDRLEVALVENVQRRDLNPIELALAFRALSAGGATQDEIGRRVSLDRSTIANHLRLLELPRELQEDVESGRLGVGHAKALLQVANPERRRHLRDRAVAEALPVRALEELARSSGEPRRRKAPRNRTPVDPNLQRVVDSLRQRLQTRVRINGQPSRGRIEIEYFGNDDLARIAALLLGDA